MKYPVITIARQFGSEGHRIGELVAERLGVPMYDKELISLAAQKSGYHPDALKQADERAAGSLLYTLATGGGTFGSMMGRYDIPINDKLFIVQNDIIKELAEEGPCVVIGRCGDYALRDFEHKLTVFIYANTEARVAHVAETEGISLDAAGNMVAKGDKRRAGYYNFYTGQKWGSPDRYDLCLSGSALGVELCADIISDVAKRMAKS